MGRESRSRLLPFLLLALGLALLARADDALAPGLSTEQTRALESRMRTFFGEGAARRFGAWRELLARLQAAPPDEQIYEVNRFFNLLDFVDDEPLWRAKDYWATPAEFLGAGAGDCEDFAIAKFFSLLELGIAEDRLRITYVKALRLNQFHMVLAYYPQADAMPLILDNIDGAIRLADERDDLLPIYSFNGASLWLARAQGAGQRVGGSERLGLWQELRERMLNGRWRRPGNAPPALGAEVVP